jgi:hypothetical protein
MRVIERSFSDLLRHPGDVTGELDFGDVLLRRRDEPDLRLTRADREDIRASAFDTVARALRALAKQHPAVLIDVLGDVFAWVEFLPVNDRTEFANEFARVAAAGSDFDNYAPLMQLVSEWRATAEIYADPDLAQRLRQPIIGDGPPVQMPTA